MDMIFSDSNQYVQDTEVLQSALGFVSAMDIDIYVKRSFFINQWTTSISGGVIASFTKDHLVDEEFLYYRIQSENLQQIASKWVISCTLEGKSTLILSLLQGLIQWTPIIAILIISIAMFFLPPTIAKIFRRISIIGIIITYTFYVWKIGRLLYKAVTNRGIDYNGLNVIYDEESDIALMHQEHFALVKQLQETIWASKIVFYQWILHTKQLIHKPSLWRSIRSFFFPHEENPISYDPRIHETSQKLLSASFIWLTPTPPHA